MEDYSNYEDDGMDGWFANSIAAAQARRAAAANMSVAEAAASHMAATRAAAGHPTIADIAAGGPQKRSFADRAGVGRGKAGYAEAVAQASAAAAAPAPAPGRATSAAPGRPLPQWVRREATNAKSMILGRMPFRRDVGRILRELTQADLLGVLKRPRAAEYFLNMALRASTHAEATYFAVLAANADVNVPGR